MDLWNRSKMDIFDAAERKTGKKAAYVYPLLSGLWAEVQLVDGSKVMVYESEARS